MDMGGTRQSGHFVSSGKSENLAKVSFSTGCSLTGMQLLPTTNAVSMAWMLRQKGSANSQEVSLGSCQIQAFATPLPSQEILMRPAGASVSAFLIATQWSPVKSAPVGSTYEPNEVPPQSLFSYPVSFGPPLRFFAFCSVKLLFSAVVRLASLEVLPSAKAKDPCAPICTCLASLVSKRICLLLASPESP